MDAARYFEEMHLAMSSQKPEYRLVLSVKVQDLGGADAYLELRQEPVSGKARADSLRATKAETMVRLLAGEDDPAPKSVPSSALLTPVPPKIAATPSSTAASTRSLPMPPKIWLPFARSLAKM